MGLREVVFLRGFLPSFLPPRYLLSALSSSDADANMYGSALDMEGLFHFNKRKERILRVDAVLEREVFAFVD